MYKVWTTIPRIHISGPFPRLQSWRSSDWGLRLVPLGALYHQISEHNCSNSITIWSAIFPKIGVSKFFRRLGASACKLCNTWWLYCENLERKRKKTCYQMYSYNMRSGFLTIHADRNQWGRVPANTFAYIKWQNVRIQSMFTSWNRGWLNFRIDQWLSSVTSDLMM